MKRHNKKTIAKWKELTDPFYKSPSAVKKVEELKAKRLFWKYANLDADENNCKKV